MMTHITSDLVACFSIPFAVAYFVEKYITWKAKPTRIYHALQCRKSALKFDQNMRDAGLSTPELEQQWNAREVDRQWIIDGLAEYREDLQGDTIIVKLKDY